MSDLPRTAGEAITEALQELARRFDSTDVRDSSTVDRMPSISTARWSGGSAGSLAVYGALYDASAATRAPRGVEGMGIGPRCRAGLPGARGAAREAPRRRPMSPMRAPTSRRRLVEPERAAAEQALNRLRQIRDLERLRATRRRLHEFVDAPGASPRADDPADEIRSILLHEARRTLRRARDVDGSLESYHALRKAARRLRHAVEAVTEDPPGLFGRRTRRLAKRAHRIQSILGDHRDARAAGRADRAERVRSRCTAAKTWRPTTPCPERRGPPPSGSSQPSTTREGS